MPTNRDHKAIHVATLDPYAVDRRKKRPEGDFSAAVQREVLDAARRQRATSEESDEDKPEKEKARPCQDQPNQ